MRAWTVDAVSAGRLYIGLLLLAVPVHIHVPSSSSGRSNLPILASILAMADAPTSAAVIAAVTAAAVDFRSSKFYKILYIDSDIDEKVTADELETRCNAKGTLDRMLVFTVVQNAFSGIEAFEYTPFDVIIVRRSLHHINAYDFIKIYAGIDVKVPFVLLLDDEAFEGRDPGDVVTATMYAAEDHDAIELGFRAILRSPFSTNSLLAAITTALKPPQEQ